MFKKNNESNNQKTKEIGRISSPRKSGRVRQALSGRRRTTARFERGSPSGGPLRTTLRNEAAADRAEHCRRAALRRPIIPFKPIARADKGRAVSVFILRAAAAAMTGPRGAAPGAARKTASDSRKWASSSGTASQGIIGQTRIKSSLNDASKKDALRLVPLGGLEEVGRNCSFLEYKDEIVIIDIGLQFPEDETPGIDYIIPNMAYLEKKKENIRAIILTHGHYDHIGGLPHVLAKLGNPPIYATSITKAICEKRQEDFPNAPKMNVVTIKSGDKIKISNYFTAFFFGVPHTIPETSGVLLETPIGNVVHFADFRIEYDDAGNPQGLDEFAAVGKMGVHTFMVDSTDAEKPGHSVSEKTVEKNLEEIFKTSGRTHHRRDLLLAPHPHRRDHQDLRTPRPQGRVFGLFHENQRPDRARSRIHQSKGRNHHPDRGSASDKGRQTAHPLHRRAGRIERKLDEDHHRRTPPHHDQARRHVRAFVIRHSGQ